MLEEEIRVKYADGHGREESSGVKPVELPFSLCFDCQLSCRIRRGRADVNSIVFRTYIIVGECAC